MKLAKRLFIIIVYIISFWGVLPFLLVLPELIGIIPVRVEINDVLRYIISVILLLKGGLFVIFSTVRFYKDGKGLPISHLPPVKLVKSGLFAFSRHPIYYGYTLVILGLVVLLESLSMLFISFPIYIIGLLIYVSKEEKALLKRYGNEYRRYRRNVPAFFPGLTYLIYILSWIVFKVLFRFSVRDENDEYIEGGYLVICPHNNYLDPLFIHNALKMPVNFLTTHDMYRTPFLSKLFSKLGSIRLNRYEKNWKELHKVNRIVRERGIVGVFPDGGRSWYGEGCYSIQLMRYITRHQIPILPVNIDNAYQSYPRWGQRRNKKITVNIYKLRTITSEDEFISIMRFLRENTFIKSHDEKATSANASGIDKIMYMCDKCKSIGTFEIDGHVIKCSRCGNEYRLTDNLFLLDDEHNLITLPEYHLKIIKHHPEKIESNNVVWKIEKETKREDIDNGRSITTADTEGVVIESAESKSNSVRMTYQQVDAVIIRSNRYLQIYSGRTLHTLDFVEDSALMFQDYIRMKAFSNVFQKKRGHIMKRVD
jgi:1-acyl-sn-glycerol-3-phosphate acyltransferase